ncbi:hypothetical protein CMI37_22710 [Candidatus Pacearchaeota archaeon]|nr:hypothetical protein [Candidatus Pacearchaeota archaeon]
MSDNLEYAIKITGQTICLVNAETNDPVMKPVPVPESLASRLLVTTLSLMPKRERDKLMTDMRAVIVARQVGWGG